MTDTAKTPAGWYPDPQGGPAARWWDGAEWTEQYAPLPQRPEALRAPEGTDTNTVWIWLVAVLPIVGIASLFLIDIDGYMASILQNPTSLTAVLALFTPGYVVAIVLGWATAIATIVFAYLDWRTLTARQVPRPFHWAYAFLVFASGGLVYPIGRSVVVSRRAGGSTAPMYVAIAVLALMIIVSIAWTIIITTRIMSTVMSDPSLYS